MKNIKLNKNKKYKITTLKHINPNNTSLSAHYQCDKYVDSIDRCYIFFETSYNNIIAPITFEDMSLGIWIINDPKYNPNSGYTGVCANCFEERTLERLKAINFPTEKSGQLVNYKYYTVAGTMNRNELEQFMMELGVEMYGSEILRGISKDLKRLELGDVIDGSMLIK